MAPVLLPRDPPSDCASDAQSKTSALPTTARRSLPSIISNMHVKGAEQLQQGRTAPASIAQTFHDALEDIGQRPLGYSTSLCRRWHSLPSAGQQQPYQEEAARRRRSSVPLPGGRAQCDRPACECPLERCGPSRPYPAPPQPFSCPSAPDLLPSPVATPAQIRNLDVNNR